MDETKALLTEIERYASERKIALSTFGARAVNDGKLVARLKAGRSITLKKAEAIRAFIASSPDGSGATA